MTKFRGYQALINEFTGETDLSLVDEIEGVMRDTTGGCLDAISRETFRKLARKSVPVAKELLEFRRAAFRGLDRLGR